MAAERDLELLDDYLANRLDEKRRMEFEQQLKNDPNLKSEYDLQQQFIQGIKKTRVAELKSMLNNVPVPAIQSGGTAVAGKIALWTVFIGLIGTGAYFYFNHEEAKTTLPEIKTEKKAEDKASVPQKEELKSQEDSPVVSSEEASSEHKPGNSPKAVKKDKKSRTQKSEPKIEVYDPTEEQESPSQPIDVNNNSKLNANPSIAVEIDSQNKKYNFHYQFKDGKLFLFGPFEKNLYEIMEFFSEDKRTMFLFYNDSYYLLKNDNSRLRPLNEIQDPPLLKKLKEFRNQ